MNADARSALRVFAYGSLAVLALAVLWIALLLRNRSRSFDPDATTLEAWLETIPGDGFRPTYVARSRYHYVVFGTQRDGRALWAVRHNEGHLRGNHGSSFNHQLEDFDSETFDFGRRSEAWTLTSASRAGTLSIQLLEPSLFGPGWPSSVRDERTCEHLAFDVAWNGTPIPASREAEPLDAWVAALPVETGETLYAFRTARHDALVARLSDGRLRVVVRHVHGQDGAPSELRIEASDGLRKVPQDIRLLRATERETLRSDDRGYDEAWSYDAPSGDVESLRVVLGEELAGAPPDPVNFRVRWR